MGGFVGRILQSRLVVSLGLAWSLFVVGSVVAPSIALAYSHGYAYPSGCDADVDIYRNPYLDSDPHSLYGTCWTRRYSPGYTAGGLTAWVQASIDGEGYSLTVDGYFGPATESKVKSWQTARGITSDGIVGNNSWVRMDEWGTVRAWTLVGTCGSQGTPGVQYLKNEHPTDPFLAIRPCAGAVNGVPNGSYCLQVDTSWYYVRADATPPGSWPGDDCLPI
ncbi:MAG: peptidoglycan-binding domain-containing protein [Acidimicrobiia bacterium]|nr:MAG: peptidoglycan-binding domain-containing protein [Acidimicrobiia bacterium]